MDLTNQSHTLDPALKASRARRTAPIRLLKKDTLETELLWLGLGFYKNIFLRKFVNSFSIFV